MHVINSRALLPSSFFSHNVHPLRSNKKLIHNHKKTLKTASTRRIQQNGIGLAVHKNIQFSYGIVHKFFGDPFYIKIHAHTALN